MDELKLITSIQQHRELYDPDHYNYHKPTVRNAIWTNIGRELGVTGADCRQRWNQLRDNHRKAIKFHNDKNTPLYKRHIRFEKELEFLRFHFTPKNYDAFALGEEPTSNDSEAGGATGDTDPPKPNTWQLNRENGKNDAAEESSDSITATELSTDHIGPFFRSIEASVRAFPQNMQLEAKSKIASIVFEMEKRVIRMRESQ